MWNGELPSCYHGTPEEMVVSIARDYGPQVSVQDAIDFVLQDVEERWQLKIGVPQHAPFRVRAALLVAALLVTGCAKETPQS